MVTIWNKTKQIFLWVFIAIGNLFNIDPEENPEDDFFNDL
jgi:hypothetical protein